MHGWMHLELNMVFSVVALQPVERQRSQAPQIQTSGTSRLRLGLTLLALFQLAKAGCPVVSLIFQLARSKPPHTIGSGGRECKKSISKEACMDPAFGEADPCRHKFVHQGLGLIARILQQLHRFLAFSQLSQPATNQFGCHVQPNVPTILPRLPRVAAAGSIRQAAPNPIVESSVMRLFRAHVAFERRLKRQAHLLRATVSQPGPV
jgi:hypothetical protein